MRDVLLREAVLLVREHGFTRKTLSLASLGIQDNPGTTNSPLSEMAVTALFGRGDDARRTLIDAWLDEGLVDMRKGEGKNNVHTVRDALRRRLVWNEPVLELLPEVKKLFWPHGDCCDLPVLGLCFIGYSGH